MFHPSGMGRIRLDSLSDLGRHGYCLKAVCVTCGHHRLLDASQLQQICIRRRWSMTLDAVEARLKCGICGGQDITAAPWVRE